ncbi:MMPL family transporter [bacterium]|nr:MMPL family transporter [bacterium]
MALISLVASLNLASQRIHFSTDRTQLLDPEHPIQRRWLTYRAQFQGNSDLLVLITGNPADVRAAAEDLATLLVREKNFFDEIFFKVDIPQISQHALYFLSFEDLQRLVRQLRQAGPWMDALDSGLPGLLRKLSAIPKSRAQAMLEPVLPQFLRILVGVNQSIESRGQSLYKSPLPAFQPEASLLREQPFQIDKSTFYNTIHGDRTCLMLVQPSDRSGSFQQDAATVARLRQLVTQVMRSYTKVDCMVCGEVVMNTDEMVGSYQDSRTSGLAALILVYGLLALAFGDFVRPLCAVVSLGVGLAWSLAFTSMAVGHLNLLTVHFATIVAGLSMTFAIQVLCYYLELGSQESNPSVTRLLVQTMAETGPTSSVGAVTTAIAFWSLNFAKFRAASELGLITGTGVLLCFCSITTLLPVLLQMTEGRKTCQAVRLPGWRSWSGPISLHPYRVLALSLFVSLYSLTWVARVPFNYNVLSLQPKDSVTVRLEKFLQTMGYSGLFAVTSAASMQEANQLAKKFEALSSVSRVETVAALEPQRVEEKRSLVKQIVALAQPLTQKKLEIPERTLSGSELLQLGASFQQASAHLQTLLLDMDQSPLRDNFLRQLDLLNRLLDPDNPGPLSAALLAYQRQLSKDLRQQNEFLRTQSEAPPDVLRLLPQALRARSVSATGRVSLRIFPNGNCWDREPLEFFVNQLQKTDPNVTGSPLLIYYYSQELRLAYAASGRNGLLVICGLLLIHFRSLKNAALAVFPKLLGVLWMVGAMGVFGVSFNSANFLALPITLGIGLIFGVNVLLECQQKGARALFCGPTGAAVALSGLTAILGFSSFLMVAHVGVSSFGFVMAAGLGANLLTSLLTLPALMTLASPVKPV